MPPQLVFPIVDRSFADSLYCKNRCKDSYYILNQTI